MTYLKTLIITTAAIISIAGNASAGESTFQTTFTIDRSSSVETQYENFVTLAKSRCASEARRAGFRLTEISSWAQRKCVRQLVKNAVRASRNSALTAFHNSSVNGKIPTRRYASSK